MLFLPKFSSLDCRISQSLLCENWTFCEWQIKEYNALRGMERVKFLSLFYLLQLMTSEQSFTWSEHTRLQKNEQKECQILQLRLLICLYIKRLSVNLNYVYVPTFMAMNRLNFELGSKFQLSKTRLLQTCRISTTVIGPVL